MIETGGETLRDEVLAELESDPRVNPERIGVIAEDGLVTLTGTVPAFAQKWAAEEAVKRVKGVRAVVEDLKVDLPATHVRDDADVARTASAALYWDTLLPASIQIVVNDGYVSLDGQVEWNYQREEAEEVVRRIAGVRGISNLIHIRQAVSAKNIRDEIDEAFKRDAHVNAGAISVTVNGSKVTLTGKVHSWYERNEASRAAWSIAGVTAVDNQLAIL
ncbi:MAG TPA: BON domain-containing protein [Candidatus Baltobacteraceae bacterium]|nr:BON domain-containing protein [Candidatus Baltobacteraceae bacterium]